MKESILNSWKNSEPRGATSCFQLYLKGILMGAADVVPGISGGTVAFLLGIYDQVLQAFSKVSVSVVTKVLTFKWSEVFKDYPLKFTVILISGILSSIVFLSGLMHILLEHYKISLYSLFFGLILGGVVPLLRKIKIKERPVFGFYFLFSLALGAVVIQMVPMELERSFLIIFLSGVIGSCAMILPGLSGASLMVVLGQYEFLTSLVRNLFTTYSLTRLGIFLLGTVCGLVSFARLLSFIFKKFPREFLASLSGLMLGASLKIWPWRGGGATDFALLPEVYDQQFVISLFLMGLGFSSVIAMEHFIGEKSTS